MKHFTRTTLGAALAASFFLAGCGGGGVNNQYPSSVSTKAVAPVGPGFDGGTALLAFQSGYTYNYKVTGTITQDYIDANGNKATQSGPVTNGTMVRAVSDTVVNGVSGFQITDTFTYTPQGGTPIIWVQQRYMQQMPDGSLQIFGMNDQSLDFTTGTPVPYAPGTFSLLPNLSGSSTMTSLMVDSSNNPFATNTFDTAFTVLGSESVPASTGAPFTAWKCQFTQTEHANFSPEEFVLAGIILKAGFVVESTRSTVSTDDWVPSIGAPVRSHLVFNGTDTTFHDYKASSNGDITYTPMTLKKTLDLNLSLQSRIGMIGP